jgi:diguanylate cyclase (GGDEF)-like protein/PAS domain S-box-containing protein
LKKILVIETSATLRHGLIKSLSDIPYEFLINKSYEDGLKSLERYLDANPDELVAVIVGWPGQTSDAADEVIALLGEDESLRKLATLVMAVEVDRIKLDWVVQRHNSALLLWEDYIDVSVSLSKMLESTEPKESAPAVVEKKVELTAKEDTIRVLLVDDSPTVRVFYKRLFISNGYVTEAASGYKEALKMAKNNHYDVAVIDYFMPDMNGDELVKLFKSEPATSHIWAAIFTGTYLDQVIKDSLDAGAVECMFKNEADELVVARLDAVSRTIRANRNVEKERRRLQGILSSVGDGVYGVNTEGLITFINPAACRILGRKEQDEFIGKTPHSLFHYALSDGTPSNEESCYLQQAYGKGKLLHAWETIFWSDNSKPLPVECTVYPLQIDNQLQGSVVAFRDISERKLLEEELKWQVNHDHLTKLLNRHYFDDELKKEVRRLKRSEEKSALLYIDLDRFKYLNDTAGHSAGDQLLVEVGQQLSARLRASDMLARLGGDEFAVILRNINIDMVTTLADQYREVLHYCTFHFEGQQYKIDGSVGVAIIDKTSKSPDEVLAHADIACHMAKQQGRNQTHVYDIVEDEKMSMDLDLGWSARLREALLNNLFELHYQPISKIADLDLNELPKEGPLLDPEVESPSLVPSHYEVLIRLRMDPEGPLIFPNTFLPTAERFNLMQEIDRWVIERAIQQLALSNSTGQKANFAINLSGHSLGDDSVLPFVMELIKEYNANPKNIIFEITETTAISNMESAQKLINELSAIGIRFSLDDFGCGFSSFAHLKQLQADYIKIDGMFVQGMLSDPIDQAMVRSMNDIAHSLGKKTIAEFVENIDILKKLDEFGVDYIQGYYLGKPTTHIYKHDE